MKVNPTLTPADMVKVPEPASIIYDSAVDPFLAKVTLARLRARIREALLGGVMAAAAGVFCIVTRDPALAVPCLAGALAGGVVYGFARSDRTMLIQRLVRQRSAYEIAEVAAAGQSLVTPQARVRLARRIARIVLEADGVEPANPSFGPLYARVRVYRRELVMLAFHLARPATRVHPSGVALIQRLLHNTVISPLYNEQLPAQQLQVALMRVQGTITAA